MKHFIFLAILSCVLTLNYHVFSQQTSAAPSPNAETEKWREDLRFMAREMEARHKNLFHTVKQQDFHAAVQRLHERIPNLERHQIIVEMMRIVAMVGDGHTNIYPTRDAKIGFHTLPVKLYVFKEGTFIRSAVREHADLVGARVVSIGAVPVDEAIARVMPLVGQDNPMGGKYFAPSLLTMPEVLHATGMSDSIENVKFTVEKQGTRREVTLKRSGPIEMVPADTDLSWMPKEGWIDMRDAAKTATPLWLRDPKNLFWHEFLPAEKTLYTQINEVGNKPTESLAAFAKRLTAFIESNPVEKLIIDLRLNRGGNGELLRPLELALVKSKLDEHGKLFFLIGRSTWSASEFFLNWMERNSNAIFVGEPSASKGNAYGDSRRITLPNSGITVRVSVYYWQHWAPWDTRRWTAPELTAELTAAAYAVNDDPVLKAALQYVPRKTLSQQLDEAITAGGIALAVKTFTQYRADPANKYAATEEPLLVAGQRFLNEKKPGDALILFKLNEAENPHSFRAYLALGVAHSQMGNKDLAIRDLQRALELNPRSYDVAERLRQLQAAAN